MYDFHVHDCTQEQNSSPYFLPSFNNTMVVSIKKDYWDPEILKSSGVTLPAELTMYLLCG